MWLKNIFNLFLIVGLLINSSFAQNPHTKNDSVRLYKNIETYSKHRKVTRFIYGLVFKPSSQKVPKKKTKKKVYRKLIVKPYRFYEGKIIRQISIETIDPFGYSMTDTLPGSQNFLSRAGNKLHIKSQRITIRNLLIIHQNQVFDSLLVKESERLVRSMGYVRDVSFSVKTTSKKSDSVDIFIRVMDNWSIIPIVIASSSRVNLRLTDKNFSGLGHEFQNGFTWYKSNGSVAFNTNYFIPNIRNTHITSTIHYGTDEYGNFLRNFAIDRPFFSPFAHWAAGVGFMQQFRKDTIRSPDSIFNPQRFKFNTQDYWAGNALPIFRGNTENSRTTNFISAIRFLRIRYLEGPSKIIDTLNIYSDENFYLVGIGISMRKYVQDKFIFKYGVTEDVPIGNVFSITAGYQDRIRNGRTYIGARISSGRYYSWGYLSSDIEYGTFFSASQAQQGVFLVSANYFTGLVEIGKWKFRQFVKPQLIIGINRFSYDSLTLNDGRGLDGFNSSLLSGSSRLLLTLQTQSYSPWDLIGFHFGPYLMCSLGMLGDERNGFKNKKAYAQLGLGVLIKNENLIISTFEISLAFYPVIPGNGHNVFKINSFKTTDFGFKDFEIGKPATIIFH